MAVDLGDKRTGIAVGDAVTRIASPVEVIEVSIGTNGGEDLLRAIVAAAKEHVGLRGSELVVGLPLNMDGTAGPRAQATRAFARTLQETFHLPLLLWDERMSTQAVVRMMEKEADLSRARRDVLVDKLAASYILQGVLDGLEHHRGQ